jgi:hypothetical protein
VYAQRQGSEQQALPAKRRGPKTHWSDAQLTERIRAVLLDSPFVGEGYRKVWAKLRFGLHAYQQGTGAAPDA